VLKRSLLSVVVFSVTATGCGSRSPAISCAVEVPSEFRTDPSGWQSPTGEPEFVRYTKAYEAFWWNCVMVRAEDLEGLCPFTCNGTPAAASGCSAGAADADGKINRLLERHSAADALGYLRSLARSSEGASKITPYFPNGPRSRVHSDFP
jgi:hypothetical protein